jgi:uncharacterized protein Yka (UPF0111/DUF47 family)
MALLRSRKTDHTLLDLFEEAGRNVQRSSLLLHDMLAEFPERSALARDLLLAEQEGDRITHDIIHRLNDDGHGRPPIHDADVYELARALDDIVDYAEQAADQLGLYGVEATMEQAVALSDVLVGTGEEVARALRALRTGADLSDHLVEIHRLENEGDRLARDGVASLFANGIDPMIVIRWKDIFESLEQAIDACETVAHILEGIALKRARRG